jgi:peptidoglycan/LPS O-acetylase OafA/YrhL
MKKLDSLTTLRFFAASAIVLFHFEGHCGVPKNLHKLPLAVSFFFILSGFILTYVYPTLETWEDRKKFFIARLARIWPAHFFYFLLVSLLTFYNLIPGVGNVSTGFLNIFLLQAWIPVAESYFSFNAPSWSISSEFFFYLCFPFIIYNWSNSWLWKTTLIFGTIFLFMWVCSYYNLPTYQLDSQITSHGLLNVNPLSRIPEFLIGIMGAHAWLKYKKWFELDLLKASLLELIALVVLALNFFFYGQMYDSVAYIVPQWISYGFKVWIGNGILASLSFVFLIMAFASGQGIFSRVLTVRFGLLLGEISFSIYLFHQIIYRFYASNIGYFVGFSNKILFSGYWLILLLGSFLVWKYIENPSRKFLINAFSGRQKRSEIIIPID